jgi:riboflavin kinase/FMN adenylyltransferase
MAGRFLATCRGRVEHGRRLGRLLGAPTANLALPRECRVTFGTFAAIVEALDRSHRAVVHVGVRPSAGAAGRPLLEAHLLDFEGDLYGRELIVHLAHKVADEVCVGSLDALARKIADDVAAVRRYFADPAAGQEVPCPT